ncbi:MAG TPA: hypothetical protein VF204_23625, partial [Streptosporangiaceae bacterium]
MAGGRRPAALRGGALGLAALALALAAAGCGGGGKGQGTAAAPSASASTKALPSCGTTKTAANVPVTIEVHRGKVDCQEAMSVERKYAAAIESGKEPGNGGGGPVKIDGWTCRGFATPVVLRTGNASKCEKGT